MHFIWWCGSKNIINHTFHLVENITAHVIIKINKKSYVGVDDKMMYLLKITWIGLCIFLVIANIMNQPSIPAFLGTTPLLLKQVYLGWISKWQANSSIFSGSNNNICVPFVYIYVCVCMCVYACIIDVFTVCIILHGRHNAPHCIMALAILSRFCMSSDLAAMSCWQYSELLWPLLITWFNFNLSMDK